MPGGLASETRERCSMACNDSCSMPLVEICCLGEYPPVVPHNSQDHRHSPSPPRHAETIRTCDQCRIAVQGIQIPPSARVELDITSGFDEFSFRGLCEGLRSSWLGGSPSTREEGQQALGEDLARTNGVYPLEQDPFLILRNSSSQSTRNGPLRFKPY